MTTSKRRITRKVDDLDHRTPKPVKHTIDGKAIASALRKANIPQRFIRPEVSLTAFPWGTRVGHWIDSSVMECSRRGKSLYLNGPAEHGMAACAMLARTLVIRGKDAQFLTLSDLIGAAEPPRSSEFLVLAGFYDDEFHKSKGMPMSAAESFRLSWVLWRLASEGTTLIVYASPHNTNADKWWYSGAITDLFDTNETLRLT